MDTPSLFTAIDFEIASHEPISACSLAMVRVENGRLVAREHRLIRPPTSDFEFTWLHGLDWEDVRAAPDFAEVWSDFVQLLVGVDFLAAHNAPFDHSVLSACCEAAGLQPPRLPFVCTVQLARRTWGIYPTRLPDVCNFLGIPLHHHDALSDAEACAQIVIAAHRCTTNKHSSRTG